MRLTDDHARRWLSCPARIRRSRGCLDRHAVNHREYLAPLSPGRQVTDLRLEPDYSDAEIDRMQEELDWQNEDRA
jgi:hypothetical protein